MCTANISVAIFDPLVTVIDGYRYRIEKDEAIVVKASSVYAERMQAILKKGEIDIVISDLVLPTSENDSAPFPIFQIIPSIFKSHKDLRILIISASRNQEAIDALVDAGVHGYILKTDEKAMRRLCFIIRSIYSGGVFFSIGPKDGISLGKHGEPQRLTLRQMDILNRLAQNPGLTTGMLAKEMCVAPSTIRNTLSKIYQKLDVHNRQGAIQKAQEQGIILQRNNSSRHQSTED